MQCFRNEPKGMLYASFIGSKAKSLLPRPAKAESIAKSAELSDSPNRAVLEPQCQSTE